MQPDYRDHFPPAPQRDSEPMRRLMARRAVATWCDFPPATKAMYLSIARCYPGVQLHACGSRVKGYYADLDDAEAQQARLLLGKPKRVSDFDYVAPAGALPVRPLPIGADQAHIEPCPGSSIPIPMADGE